MTAIVFDVEAVAIDSAGNYLEPVAAPGNYKDPDKIAAYCAQAQIEQLAKAALDIDLGRIVALGTLTESASEPTVHLARDEQDERELLAGFWPLVTKTGFSRPTLVGFNCLGYDLPLMLRRSLYLGIQAPRFQMGKYRHDGIDDLMLTLSFDGAVKYRGLSFYCKRFNIDVPDLTSGKDIAAMHAAGEWDDIAAHCRADVLKTAKLAQRIGVLQPQAEAVL
jgi:predicted PolB exonuclease-like 3'-5' exonuclease